jgi:hypothetical protein
LILITRSHVAKIVSPASPTQGPADRNELEESLPFSLWVVFMTLFRKVLVDATAVAFHLHHRDILDAIAMFFSEHEQLGVEKPGLVLNLRDDRGCPVVCLVYRTPPVANECQRS